MASTLTFSHLFLSLTSLLLFTSLFSLATSIPDYNLRLSSTANFPKVQAEKLIRGLNLFPKGAANVGIHDTSVTGEKIVEKRLKLPVLADSGASVEELGHHAGYYRLPHSQAARYIFSIFLIVF